MIEYQVIDVFSDMPFRGNPVAVVFPDDTLDGEAMQDIASWFNLSETTFVLPSTKNEVDYSLRIFTPKYELPFAGHPTLGSAFAFLNKKKLSKKRLIQVCKSGLIDVLIEGEKLFLEIPLRKMRPLLEEEIHELESVVGIAVDRELPPLIVDVGAVWIVAHIPRTQDLMEIDPNFSEEQVFENKLGATGITLFSVYVPQQSPQLEVRSFAASCGVKEDPVCGSGNGAVAAFMQRNDRLSCYVARQGQKVGRDGIVNITTDKQRNIYVGGKCFLTATGNLFLASS